MDYVVVATQRHRYFPAKRYLLRASGALTRLAGRRDSVSARTYHVPFIGLTLSSMNKHQITTS
jgi:hypothetical protein